jgi:hypothetical protein
MMGPSDGQIKRLVGDDLRIAGHCLGACGAPRPLRSEPLDEGMAKSFGYRSSEGALVGDALAGGPVTPCEVCGDGLAATIPKW